MKTQRHAWSCSVFDREWPLLGRIARQLVPLRSEQLEECLESQRQGSGLVGLGQIMLRQRLIPQQQIVQVLQFQAHWVATALRGDMGPTAFPSRIFLSLCLPPYNEQANVVDTVRAETQTAPATSSQWRTEQTLYFSDLTTSLSSPVEASGGVRPWRPPAAGSAGAPRWRSCAARRKLWVWPAT